MIVIIEIDQLAQFQMPGERGGFRRHAFHQIAVADQSVGEMMNDLKPWPIVPGGQIRFGDGHAHPVTESLTEWTCGDFHAGGHAALGVTGRVAAPLAKLFDLVEREIIACEIQ